MALSLITAFQGLSDASDRPARPHIIFEPKKVGPGDVLVATIRNVAGPVEGKFNGKKIYFNKSRKSVKAVIGIDLYTAPGKYGMEITVNGATVHKTVTVAKKEYPTQRLTLPRDMVELSPENEARVEREQRKISALWQVDSERIWSGNFINPLPGKEIGTPFGVRRIINNVQKNPHSGVDLTADEGEPVRAPNDGVVVFLDDQFFSGNSLILDHGQGIYTMFFHLSKISVSQGQAVMKGDVIGLVGSTGRATGPHLHWGARMQGARVDPMKLLKLRLE